MREFNKVSAKYWLTPLIKKIKQLGTDAMYLSIYLQTNHHTHSLGVFYLPIQYIAHDTGMPVKNVQQQLQALCDLDHCLYDFEQEYIWVKDYALEQSSGALKGGDSRIIQAQKYFQGLPALDFLEEFYLAHKDDFHLPQITEIKTLPPVEAPSTPRRRTETETKTQTETKTDTETERETSNIVALPRPIEKNKPEQIIFEHWKATMNHPKAKLDSKRKRLILEAIKLGYDYEQLCEAISGCALTPHNIGMNDNGQRYDGLHVILRNADQIDRFIRNYYEPPQQLNKTMQKAKNTYHQLQGWIHAKEENEHVYF